MSHAATLSADVCPPWRGPVDAVHPKLHAIDGIARQLSRMLAREGWREQDDPDPVGTLRLVVDELQQALVGGGELALEEVDVEDLLTARVRAFRHRAGGEAVVVLHAADVPAVRVDPALFGQAVDKVLTCALAALQRARRTGPGRIAVRTAATRDGVVIRVADDGPAFPEGGLDAWAGIGGSHPRGGHASSLLRAREALRRMGGELEIEPPGARGAVVRLRLPIPARTASAAPRTVLVVDAGAVGDTGPGVTVATTAAEAIARLAGGLRPDLIVYDHELAGLDAVAFHATLVRRWPELAGRLVLSGDGDADEALIAFPTGVWPHLVRKPLDPAALAAANVR